jgi:hypothetical protein
MEPKKPKAIEASKGNAFAKAIKTQGLKFFMGKNTNVKGLW